MEAYLPLLVLLITLIVGIPIAISLAVSGMLGIYIVTGDLSKVMGIVSMAPFSSVADYALTTIPMFILMAYLSASSGLARDLYLAASNWMSHIKGGLAMATVVACGIFGAMSGASVAAASVMSRIAMPEMRRHGYSEELAAGSIGIGATLDILIPPSIAMVIYGIATQTSIGKLLIAGVIPGIIVGILLAASIYIWVTLSPSHAPETFRVPKKERWDSVLRIWPSLVLILIVLILLYTGVATPSEVGAFAVVYAVLIGLFAYRQLKGASFREALEGSLTDVGAVMFIIAMSGIFGYGIVFERIPELISGAILGVTDNPQLVLVLIVAFLLLAGLFIDGSVLIIMLTPIFLPLATTLGIDPVHFGLVFVVAVTIGNFTPPVGAAMYAVCSILKCPIGEYTRESAPFLLAVSAVALLLIFVPEVVLLVPNLIFGKE